VTKKAGGILAGLSRSNRKRKIDTSKVNPKRSTWVWVKKGMKGEGAQANPDKQVDANRRR
jgi:hypothetical protein